jgi:transcriptional regulator with XRE-family HTH domain
MDGMGQKARDQLARRLRMLRLVRGWSQEDLAAASGLHRTYVSLVERARSNIGLDNVERLAGAFDLTPSDLLAASDAPFVAERLLAVLSGATRRKKSVKGP